MAATILIWLLSVTSILSIVIQSYVAVFAFMPFHNPSPQRVNSFIVGSKSPSALISDGYVITLAQKCNNSRTALQYYGEMQWTMVEPFRITVGNKSGNSVREPGCHNYTYRNIFPPDLIPGTWRIEGFDRVIDPIAGRIQEEPWYTENFEVLP